MSKRISSLKLTYEEQHSRLRAGDGQSRLTAVKQTVMEDEKEMPVVPDENTPSPQLNTQIEDSSVSDSLYPISQNHSLPSTRKRLHSRFLIRPPPSVLPDNTLTNHIYGTNLCRYCNAVTISLQV